MVSRGAVGTVLARCAVVTAVLAAASAHADSPRLAQARRAVEAVDYDDARRLLLEALHDGGNSPAALGEIYRLSARAAIVLGQRDVAEQYYRRWLAIDPDAALPGDAAPKLREPFIAAQAYIAAHGRLLARAQRASTGEIDVELIADPLAMARAAAVLDPDDPAPAARPVAFGADRRAHLAAGARAAILDDSGNRLLELDLAAPAAAPPAEPAASDTPLSTDGWLPWAIPTGLFGLVAAGFGIAAISSYQRAESITTDSGQYHLSDAEDNRRRGRTFLWITGGAGAATLVCGIPTAIYYLRARERARTTVAPTGGNGQLGIAVIGRF